MEADSTIKNNLISWQSAETLDDIDQLPFIRNFCKVNEGQLFESIKVKTLLAEEGRPAFFVESKLFLLCQQSRLCP